MKKTPLVHWAAALAVVLVSTQLARAQTTYTGVTSGGTVWTNSANWSGGVIPDSTNAVVVFTNTSATNAWTNDTITVGTINVTNLASGSVIIGSGTATNDFLELATSSGTPTIAVGTNVNATLYIYATLTGTQGFTKTGNGNLTFRFNTSDMLFSGNINLNAGTLTINQDGSLGNTNNDIIVGGTSTLSIQPGGNTGSVTLGAGRSITINTGTLTLNTLNNNAVSNVATTVNGVISGAGAITFAGAGYASNAATASSYTLNGANTYAGQTTVQMGSRVILGAGASLGTNTLSLSGGSGAYSQLDLGGNVQNVASLTTASSSASARTMVITNGTLNVGSGGVFTLNGTNGTTVDMSGLTAFTFNGAAGGKAITVQPDINTVASTVTNYLLLANSGAGSNNLSASAITIGGASGATTNASATNNGGSYLAWLRLGKLNSLSATNLTVGGYNGAGRIDFQSGITNGSLVLRGSNGVAPMTTLSLGLTSSGVRSGAGTLDLTGGSLDALVTTISIGNNTTALADTSALIMPTGTVVANTLKIGTTTTGTSSPNMTNFFSQGGGSVTVTNLVLGENGAGAGSPNFIATYSNTGGTLYAGSISNGSGAVGASTVRTLALNGASATLRHIAGSNLTVNGSGTSSTDRINLVVGASGGTIVVDSGRTVTLGGNTRSSGTGVLSKTGVGTLIILGDNTHSGGTTLSAGTIEAASDTALGIGTIGLNSGTLLASGASRSYTNAVSVGGNVTLGGAGNALTFSGNGSLGGAMRTITTADNVTFSGAISNGGITKVGGSTMTLSGANTYGAGTVVSAGTLVASGSGLQGAVTNNSAVILSGSGTYSGAMSGTGSLTKESAGNYTLSGNNDFNGATTVSGGRLIVNGTNANSTVTVSSGASLGGNGEVGALTVGGTLAPGNSIGTLSAGNTTFLGNGAFELEVFNWTNSPGTGWDLFDITGDLTLSNTSGSPFTINLVSLSDSTTPGLSTGWNANLNYTNTFINYSGSLLGETFNTNLFTFNLSGFLNPTNGSFSVIQVTNGLALLYETAFVPATAYVWNAGSGDWSVGSNWDGNNAPTNGAVLVFTGGTGFSTNNAQMTDVQGLTFSNTTGSLTLDGSAFSIAAAGIFNNTTNAHIINNNLNLAASSEFSAASNSLTFAGNVTNDFALTVSGAENTDISGIVSGTGSLIKSSAGTLTLSGANTYSGGSTVSGGAIFAANDSALGSGNITLNSGVTLAASGAARSYTNTVTLGGDVTLGGLGNSLTLSGAVNLGGSTRTITMADNTTFSGAMTNGGLTKAGTGTVILSGANTYSGGTTLSAGAIEAANDSAIGSGTLALNGGTFAASGATRSYNNSVTVGGDVTLGGLGNVLTLSGGVNLGGSMRIITTADGVTLSGIVSNGGLTKAGLGTMTLSGANSYSGGTVVSAGVLSGSTTSLQGAITITNNASVVFSQTTNGTYSGVMSGGGSLAKSGSGTITLSGANSYSGGTLLSAGGLIGDTTSLQGSITNNGAVTFSQSTNGTYAGAMSGSGALTKSGSGTITLNGANTYTGTTTINGGSVVLGTGSAISTNNLTFAGTAGILLDLGGNSQSVARLATSISNNASTITISNGSLTINGTTNATQTFNATVNGSGTDMSALNNFTFTSSSAAFQAFANGANVTNTVQLSKLGTNNITAPSVTIGQGSAGGGASGQTTRLLLGQVNNFNASTHDVGAYQGSGSIAFNSGVTNGVLTLRGEAGGSTPMTTLRIGMANSGSVSTVGTLDLTGGSLDLLATDVYVGYLNANAASSTSTGTLTMPGGTVVAGNLSVAAKSATTGSSTSTGTFNQSGGSVTATNLYLGNSATPTGSDLPNLVANYNLTGGTLYAQTISGNGANYGASTVRNLNLNGGTVRNISGSDLAINGLASTTNGRVNVVLGSSGGTFEADSGRNITIGANSLISSTGRLTKAGEGTLTVASGNTYSGGTLVGGGTIVASNNTAFGTARVTITNGAVVAAAGQSIANNFSLGDSGIVVTGSVTNSFSGYYNFGTSSGDANLTSSNGGNITFGAVSAGNNAGAAVFLTNSSASTGPPTYTGASGGYNAGANAYAGVLSNGSTYFQFTLTANSGYNLSLTNLTFGSRSTGSGPSLVTLESSIDNYGNALATSAVATNGNWALVAPNVSASEQANGAVTFRIYGSGGTGGSSSANWRLDDLNLYGVTISNNYVTNAASGSGTLGIQQAGSATFSGGVTVYTAGTLTAAANGEATFSGAIGGAGSITKTGSGTVILTGSNNYIGGTLVSAGVLSGTTAGLQGAITNNATVSFNQSGAGTYAGVMSGTGTLVKLGGGTVILAGANSYDGGTLVSAGALQVDTTSIPGSITITNNATVIFDQAANGTYSNVVSGSGVLVKGGSGTVTLTGANSYSGGTLVNAGGLQVDTTSVPGSITNNATVIFDQAADGTYGSAMSGSGVLVKQSAGTLTLSASNSYAGGTSLTAGGLRLTHASAAGTGTITQSTNTFFEIDTTGTVANAMDIYNISTLQTVTLSGNKTLNNATYTVASGTTTTDSGNLSGIGGVTKEGTGTLILTGNNTYSGAVDVNAGLLNLNSSSGGAAGSTTSVSVATNATLLISQSDQVNNGATVSLSGGTISRASGVSEVFGNLNVSASSFLDFGSGTSGNLTFGTYTPSSLVTVANFFGGNTLVFGSDLTGSIAVGTYNTTSYLSGDGLFQINSISGGFTTSYNGGSFTITAIPEPSTYAAAVGLLGLMLWPSRRRIFKDAKAILGLRAPMRDRLAKGRQ